MNHIKHICAKTTLTVLSESEFANCLKESGHHIKRHFGRYWFSHPWGFYHPIHWMAELCFQEVTRPAVWCWGFRSSLISDDAAMANSRIPVHMICDLHDYGIERLSPRRRNKLRNCWRQAEIVNIETPELLCTQGYGVVVSAQSRTGYGALPTRNQFRRFIDRYYNNRQGLVLGSLVDGNLGGFIMLHAIDGTAYIDSVYLDTSCLQTNIGLGMLFECLQICRRTVGVYRVVHGLHTPENKSLCDFKRGLGFQIVDVPAYSWFMPAMETYIRKNRPNAYYRLTGRASVNLEAYV